MKEARLIRPRFILAAAFLLTIASLTSVAAADDPPNVRRTWTSASGKFTITGVLTGHDDEQVTIKPESRAAVTVGIKQLCSKDQDFLCGLRIIQTDQEIFDRLMAHRDRYKESPRAVLEIVEELSDAHPSSPYASMMAGIALASEMNELGKAQRYFKRAEDAIVKAQEVLGPKFHQLTAKSVANNQAVNQIKLRKGDVAVRHLVNAVQDDTIPFPLYHNATLLMESGYARGSVIRLKKEKRGDLARLLSRKAPAQPGIQVPRRFLYSLEWDNPISQAELSAFIQFGELPNHADTGRTAVSGSVFQSERQLVDRGYTEHVTGSGFLIAPDLLITNRHVVQSKSNKLSYTITRYLQDGTPELVGGSILKWSAVDEEDLALIQLSKPMDSAPLAIRAETLERNTPLTVVGFPKIFTRGEHILATGGKFLSYDQNHPWHYCSSKVAEGNSGGPCLDENGNVAGIAFGRKERRVYKTLGRYWLLIRDSKHCVSIKPESLRNFVKATIPDFEFAATKESKYPNRQELLEATRGSVMLLKSWIPPSELVEQTVSDRSRGKGDLILLANLREQRLYPDLGCMTCRGKGLIDCPVRGCTNGYVTEHRTVQSGVDPVGGANYRSNRFKRGCKHCDGRGHLDCPDCQNGKLGLLGD